MLLTGVMGKLFAELAREHMGKGHKLVFVQYGNPVVNVALECEKCGEVIIDADVKTPKIPKIK